MKKALLIILSFFSSITLSALDMGYSYGMPEGNSAIDTLLQRYSGDERQIRDEFAAFSWENIREQLDCPDSESLVLFLKKLTETELARGDFPDTTGWLSKGNAELERIYGDWERNTAVRYDELLSLADSGIKASVDVSFAQYKERIRRELEIILEAEQRDFINSSVVGKSQARKEDTGYTAALEILDNMPDTRVESVTEALEGWQESFERLAEARSEWERNTAESYALAEKTWDEALLCYEAERNGWLGEMEALFKEGEKLLTERLATFEAASLEKYTNLKEMLELRGENLEKATEGFFVRYDAVASMLKEAEYNATLIRDEIHRLEKEKNRVTVVAEEYRKQLTAALAGTENARKQIDYYKTEIRNLDNDDRLAESKERKYLESIDSLTEERDRNQALVPGLQSGLGCLEKLLSDIGLDLAEYKKQAEFWDKAVAQYVAAEENLRQGMELLTKEVMRSDGLESDSRDALLQDMYRQLEIYEKLYAFASALAEGTETGAGTEENLQASMAVLKASEEEYLRESELLGNNSEMLTTLAADAGVLLSELEEIRCRLEEDLEKYNLYLELFMNDGTEILKKSLDEDAADMVAYENGRYELFLDYFLKSEGCERAALIPAAELITALREAEQSCLQFLEEDIDEGERLVYEAELEKLTEAIAFLENGGTDPEPGSAAESFLRRCTEFAPFYREQGAALVRQVTALDGTESLQAAENLLMKLQEEGIPDYLLYCCAGYLKQFYDFSSNRELASLYSNAVRYSDTVFSAALETYLSEYVEKASEAESGAAWEQARQNDIFHERLEKGLAEKKALVEVLEKDRHFFFAQYVEPMIEGLERLRLAEKEKEEEYSAVMEQLAGLESECREAEIRASECFNRWQEALSEAELAEKIYLYVLSPWSKPEDVLAEAERVQSLISDYELLQGAEKEISLADDTSAEEFFRRLDTELFLTAAINGAEAERKALEAEAGRLLRDAADTVTGQLFRFDGDTDSLFSETASGITDMRNGLPDGYFDNEKKYASDVLLWMENVDEALLHDFGIAYYWRSGCEIDVPIYRDQNFIKLRSYGYAFSYPVEYTDNTATRAVYETLASDERTHLLYSFFEEMMKNGRVLFDTSFIGKDVSRIAHDYLWNISKEKESHYKNSHKILNALTRKASKMKSMRKGMADVNGNQERGNVMSLISGALQDMAGYRLVLAESEKSVNVEIKDADTFLDYCYGISGIRLDNTSLIRELFGVPGEKACSFISAATHLKELCVSDTEEVIGNIKPEKGLELVAAADSYGDSENILLLMEITGRFISELNYEKSVAFIDAEGEKSEAAAFRLSEDCRYWTEGMTEIRNMGESDWERNLDRLLRERSRWETETAEQIALCSRVWDRKWELLGEKMKEWATETALLEAAEENALTAGKLGLDAFALQTSVNGILIPDLDLSPEIRYDGTSLSELVSLAARYNEAASVSGELTEIFPLIQTDFSISYSEDSAIQDFYEEVKRESTYLAVLRMKDKVSEMYRQIILDLEKGNADVDKAVTDVLEGHGYRLNGRIFSRKIMIDETVFGGIEYETQEIEKYRWFTGENFSFEDELSSQVLRNTDSSMLRYKIEEAGRKLNLYARETFDTFNKHIGYVPVMSEDNPEKVSVKGAGEYGRIFELFFVNEGRLARGLAAIDVPFYLQKLYDDDKDNDGKSDGFIGAPTIRGTASILSSLLGGMNPVLGILAGVMDTLAFSALDMGFTGKTLQEAATDVGYYLAERAMGAGIGAALGTVSAVAENSFLAPVADLYITNVTTAALLSADIDEFAENYMEYASVYRNYNKYIGTGLGSMTGGIGSVGYELLTDGSTKINILNVVELNLGKDGPVVEFGLMGEHLNGILEYIGNFAEDPVPELYPLVAEAVSLPENEIYTAMAREFPPSVTESVIADAVMELLCSDTVEDGEILPETVIEVIEEPWNYDFPVEGDIGRGYSYLEGTIGEYRAVEKEFSPLFKEEFASMSASEQLKELRQYYTRVQSEKYTDADRGNMASALRDLVKYMDVEGLMRENEDFMNITLRNFLNLGEDGTMNYDFDIIKEDNGIWTEMMSWGSAYHQTNVEGNLLNAKFVHRDGREVVFDSDEKVVLDILDKGTFNYGEQTLISTLFGLHRSADVEPYNRHMKNIGARVKHRFDLLLGMLGNSELWELRGKK